MWDEQQERRKEQERQEREQEEAEKKRREQDQAEEEQMEKEQAGRPWGKVHKNACLCRWMQKAATLSTKAPLVLKRGSGEFS